MDDNDKTAVNVRKLQESQANFLKAGFHLELAKWHWALFKAYTSVGFTEVEALKLVKANIVNHK